MKNFIVVGIVAAVLVIGGVYWFNFRNQPSVTSTATTTTISPSVTTDQSELTFQNPKKSAHYESNTPAHATTLAAVPINIVIDFNFDLAKPSEIKILKDDQDFGVGETLIDENKLTLRRNVSPAAPDGLYTVWYNACWPDATCHDGSFQFAINRAGAAQYLDLTNQPQVTVDLKNNLLVPPNIIISKGTAITWVNQDDTDHYINTDSHPYHTYYPSQNSKVLKKGETFSLTFDQPGVYPYHCSAHAASMIGNIIVR